jgi:hypothetical protein
MERDDDRLGAGADIRADRPYRDQQLLPDQSIARLFDHVLLSSVGSDAMGEYVCPTCGGPLKKPKASPIRDADWLLGVLKGYPHREVYRGHNGGWWLTRGDGAEIDPDAVRELLRRGEIVSVYSDCPNDAYHVGRTLDTKRTIEARKANGNRAIMIYLSQQTPGA